MRTGTISTPDDSATEGSVSSRSRCIRLQKHRQQAVQRMSRFIEEANEMITATANQQQSKHNQLMDTLMTSQAQMNNVFASIVASNEKIASALEALAV
ncbi:hypothetical protein BGX27_004448, partial [Mortierella sp. AM989]